MELLLVLKIKKCRFPSIISLPQVTQLVLWWGWL